MVLIFILYAMVKNKVYKLSGGGTHFYLSIREAEAEAKAGVSLSSKPAWSTE